MNRKATSKILDAMEVVEAFLGRKGQQKLGRTVLMIVGIGWSLTATAQLEVVNGAVPQRFFGGTSNAVQVQFHNGSNGPIELEVNVEVYQASSATVAPAGGLQPWKKIGVFSGQTVLESAMLGFPAVRGKTRFIVQWRNQTNILGETDVFIYPTNLLKSLGTLAGDKPLGVFDPQNELKPWLKKLDVEFDDLEDSGLKSFSGKLALIGPFSSLEMQSDNQVSTRDIKALAANGAAVVWIQATADKPDKLRPSFYSLLEKQTAVVVVQPDLVTGLADHPEAQLNLIGLCQLAIEPHPLTLPEPVLSSAASK